MRNQTNSMEQYNNNNNTNCSNNNNNTDRGDINIKNNSKNTYNRKTSTDHLSPVQNFYKGKSVLITGATGFVGKALTEKLLRSCPGLTNIYLLIRSKRGIEVDKRFWELMKNPVFSHLQKENPTVLKKVVAIPGDVTQPVLGMSEKDMERMRKEVNVVFHSAATVKFNETLQDAVRLNTEATQHVIQFCSTIKSLQALVHVSTAYSNADKRTIEEIVYPPPADPTETMNCCNKNAYESLDCLTESLLGSNHPNTYTLTKAMAEWVVAEQADNFPTAVVRPSIVTAAYKEPAPGWVDNISGITGIMMEIGRGTIRSIICDQELIVDIIPVDIVANTLIVAAWHTSTYRCNDVRVYNCTSGTMNGIRWKHLGDLTQYHALQVPTRHIQWYPGFSFRTNRLVHLIYEIFFHFLPAFIIDIVLKAQGSKPIMMKIFRRFKSAAKTGEFFALNEWTFCCENQKLLATDMVDADRTVFQTNISIVQWDDYVKNYMIGIRKFVLKDSMDSLPSARKKLKMLYWLHKIAQFLAIFLLLKMLQLR